jgi:hypothetical protein
LQAETRLAVWAKWLSGRHRVVHHYRLNPRRGAALPT